MAAPVPSARSPLPASRRGELRRVGRGARRASRNAWVERLSRMGLAVRGVLYFIPGFLTLRWALGRGKDALTPASAIEIIGRQPLGHALLMVVAVGLAGYALWGLIRAVMDPLQRGHSFSGIVQRAGYVSSALAYGVLFLATVKALVEAAPQAARQADSSDWAHRILAHPFGQPVLVGIGLCWIFGSGAVQVFSGVSGNFRRDLDLGHLKPTLRRAVTAIGRVGLVARGLVFALVGIVIIDTATQAGEHPQAGIGGALVELARQPYGRVLLVGAGLGLMAFGLYSMACARWLAMNRRDAPPAPAEGERA